MVEPEILAESLKYEDDWIKIFTNKLQFPNKNIAEWTYLDLDDVVVIVAIDEFKNVYLVREWRPAWKKQVIEVPAGCCKAKDEAGRIEQARNELMEEVGLNCKNITKLCSILAGTRTKSRFHIYLATNLFASKKDGA